MNYSYNMLGICRNNYTYNKHPGIQNMPMQVFCLEPYVVSALMSLTGKKLVVETVRGSLTGILLDVKPDHIVVGERYGSSKFFIRIAEIVHIMPVDDEE